MGSGPRWRLAQAAALLGLLGAVVALVAAPSLGLRLVWSAAVPVLPAVFLLSPALWRNVCPLATLGTGGAPATPRTTSERRARRAVIAHANAAGIVILVVLLPARRLLLNESALATLALVAAAGLAAWTLGRRGERKAGFCNAFCPVLPVERLYGQSPLVAPDNPRCAPCTVCTTRGCLDLAGRKAVAQVLGPGRRSRAWLREPFGAFAASFPGLVLAYGLAPALAGNPVEMVGLFLALGAVSWIAVLAAAVRGRPFSVLVPACAAVAAATYYWFAGPDLGRAWGMPALGEAFRVAGLGVVGLWVVARR